MNRAKKLKKSCDKKIEKSIDRQFKKCYYNRAADIQLLSKKFFEKIIKKC